MAFLLIAPTHEAAERKREALRAAGVPEQRLAMATTGDPDTIAEQAQAFAEVGIQGMTLVIPDAHDLEPIELAGRTLAPVFAA